MWHIVMNLMLVTGFFAWLCFAYLIFMVVALSFQDWRAKRQEQAALNRVPFPGGE